MAQDWLQLADRHAAERVLNLGDPGDPLKAIVAAKIIASAQMGERDPKRMTADALAYFWCLSRRMRRCRYLFVAQSGI
jgi:hypothetical protein